ncbi:MAG: thiolase family protein [Polyangiaceae bacterium]|nr:thiolase family protein [Polyangiaceae bacterium]
MRMHVHVLGVFTTAFGKQVEKSYKDLVREAVFGAVNDAGLADASSVGSAWFGNCNMALWGQANIRGQVCLAPLVSEGFLREGAPVTNVEGGCATGSLAFHGACKDILAGAADLCLAVGAEKMFFPDADTTRAQFLSGVDRLDIDGWQKDFHELGVASGRPFEPSPDRVLFVDVYAMKASLHMKRHGTTALQMAQVAAKNHTASQLNEKAHYRSPMTAEQVLADRVVCSPLTRSMCAPLSDGASAVLVCSDRFLNSLPKAARERTVRVRAAALVGGRARTVDEPSVTRRAAERLYNRAGLTPSNIRFAEVHDATSWSEIDAIEALGFCPIGDGGAFSASGATERTGIKPVNVSGGLVSKGHPLAATGLTMLEEVTRQLRGEAGARQIARADVGLAHNAGGMIGIDEATCSLVVLERR